MIRIYHPTGNAWQDVEQHHVESWTESGWLTERPEHIDDSAALPVDDTAPPKPSAPKASTPKK